MQTLAILMAFLSVPAQALTEEELADYTAIVYHVECYGLAEAAQLPTLAHRRKLNRYTTTHADYIKLQLTVMTSIVNLNTSQMSDAELDNMMRDADYNKNMAGLMYSLKCQ